MRSTRLAPLALAALASVTLLGACGSDSSSSSNDSTTTTSTDDAASTTDPSAPTTAPGALPKPDVKIPETLPTSLVVTDLTPGEGPKAANGDTVVVHYIGVRSEDGTEFDNSYDRGEPFPVTLGAGQVIQGWDEGLVGVQQGTRRQLDIPADLAYGDSPQGDVIKPGDALTFVVDVLAVLPAADPADEPKVDITAGETVDSLKIEDITEGSGDPITAGKSVAFNYIIYRTDTAEQLESTWQTGQPQNLPFPGNLPEVLQQGFDGLQVGTLRKLSIPYAEAKNVFQLDGETDIILVIDVVAIY
ncbi:MAG: FKBP-type peptidyl-prolyl cis-trans isomerase [Ilumatobacteraceae bacterium]